MQPLTNKCVLLGITGGIAAYKSAELTRCLRDQGAAVRVVMTRAATEFITPLTLQALSGRPVHTDLLDHHAEAAMGHIELARWADVIVVAPATANFIARLANGMADDLLTTLCLASASPVLVAPAMNQQMWTNQATQMNVAHLRERGVALLGPTSGEQACGEVGPGRMLEPQAIMAAIISVFRTNHLAGAGVLITAGPTRELIDPVRYISNRSSGKMGYAVAQAAMEAGAKVTLVSGPVTLTAPGRMDVIEVISAEQMREAVLGHVLNADIFISAAAVADYRCVQVAKQKIKKRDADISLRLKRTPDILSEVSALEAPPFTVGFAAETEKLTARARQKLKKKKLDMIAANQVGEGLGFESDMNALAVYWSGGSEFLGAAPKQKLARELIDLIAERYDKTSSSQPH